MSRSAKRLILLFPLLIAAAFVMQRGAADSPDAPAGGARSSAGSLPALAALEGAPAQSAPAETDAAGDAPAARPAPVDRPDRPDGRSVTVRMLVTAYCPCAKCCGKHSDGVTASGKSISANHSRFVAADTGLLPFGTRVSVPGYDGGHPVPVLDRGGKIKGRRLDVFFLSHRRALQWGRRWVDVTVYLD